MVGFSRKADYALVVLAELAELDGEARSAAELAETTEIPAALLRNVLKDLARAGLLEASRGPFGGYAFVREPATVTVLEAVEAVGDGVSMTRCCTPADEREDGCGLAAGCRIRPSLHRLHDEIVGVLGGTTIADLLETAEQGAGDDAGGGLPIYPNGGGESSQQEQAKAEA